MKRYLFLLMTLFTLPAMAQTFYEVNYVDPDDDTEYTGLLIYYDDEHCTLRLITEESLEKDEVFESAYVQSAEGKSSKDDVGVMCYVPEDEDFPTFVWIWEKDDASDISEKPFCTFDANDEDSYFEVEYFTEISMADMDQEYVEQFYSEGEPEYKMLMKGIRQLKNQRVGGNTSVAVTPTPSGNRNQTVSAKDATLHLLMVANTDVSDIGVACKRDLDNVRGEFSAIAKVLGMGYDEQIVAANSYNKANTVKLVKGAKASPNDVLVFIYTGHGFRFDNQKDYYPNIDLCASNYDDVKKNYVAMTDIYNELISKGARLNIILSDCCNTQIGVSSPMTNQNSLFSRAVTNFDTQKLQSLFLGQSGNVRATASSPGEMSWCGVNGGFFLLSFIESLRSQISPLQAGEPSWDNLLSNAISSARAKSISGATSKEQNGLKNVKTKAVSFTSLKSQKDSDGQNIAPSSGGSTLDL